MLVLSRKQDETIVINGDITITVVKVKGDTIRLGIEAPKEVPIHRGELHERMNATPECDHQEPCGA